MKLTIARAPLRISFVGGGTDYPEFFEYSQSAGCVVGASINQYVYVSCLNQPPFEEVKFRFTYRKTEAVQKISEITHPVLRTVLEQRDWDKPLNLATMASLPGRSGLGSSSAFTVAMVLLMNKLQNRSQNPLEVAMEAIGIERDTLKEAGGYQDQLHSSIGGFRMYQFRPTGITVSEQIGYPEVMSELSNSVVLVATGKGRNSSDFARHAARRMGNARTLELGELLSNLAKETYKQLLTQSDSNLMLSVLASAMNEGWELKKRISGHNSGEVDDLIKKGMQHGAISGKLCGAGGSGFALFLVPVEQLPGFKKHFNHDDLIFPKLTSEGASIVEF